MKHFWRWSKNEDTGQRELWLEGVISDSTWYGDEVTPAIFKEELHSGRGPVLLHINSPGGDCIAASQIYTFLMDYPYDVIVQIDGIAASAASVIAMAGTTVRMSPTAMMMLHNPWTTTTGDASEMQKAIDLLDEVKESIINAYQIKTGLSRIKLSNIMDSETWLNAHKAKELGFCDEVLYEGEDAAEETGARPDFIFSEKNASFTLMNKVLESIPRLRDEPEPVPEPETVEAPDDNGYAVPDESNSNKDANPVTPVPDNRVRAADLQKRLSLLK